MQDLDLYLSNLSIKFSVMGFSETWLNSTNCSLYSIDGYNVESAYRSSRKGGGVSLYVREYIVYTCRTDLDIFDECIESKFIEIDKKKYQWEEEHHYRGNIPSSEWQCRAIHTGSEWYSR